MAFCYNFPLKTYRKLGVYLAFAKALFLTTLLTSCNSNTNVHLDTVDYKRIEINDSLAQEDSIAQFIAPYGEKINQEMNRVLCYNPKSMHKNDTPLNTALGNMLCEIIVEQVNPVVKSRLDTNIDVVLLNHGGIRAPLPAGEVTTKRAYEIMPFENEVVVAQLNKAQMEQLIQYIVDRERAHPFSGMKISLNADSSLNNVSINDQPLTEKIYYVATSDYLYNGGDSMNFFNNTTVTKTDYKIRNAMIDYFKKVDTLKFESDNRFTKAN